MRRATTLCVGLVLICCLVASFQIDGAAAKRKSRPALRLPLSLLGIPEAEVRPMLQKGISCVACTLVVGIIEQVHNQTVDEILDKICTLLPTIVQAPCEEVVAEYGPAVTRLIDDEETPDVVCQQIDLCDNKTCSLFPKDRSRRKDPRATTPAATNPWTRKERPLGRLAAKLVDVERERRREALKRATGSESTPFSERLDAEFDPWQWLVQLISNAVNSHKPIFDFDGDLFSNVETLRGSFWRGKDCNDGDPTIYPGRKASSHPASVDHNCNGISGVDSQGRSYEDLLCGGTPQFGQVILGDSAGAHFHVPARYITAERIDADTYSDFVDILTMEFDWPEMSAGTGFYNSTWTGHPQGGLASGYLSMVQRNLCMHRDYQSIAVNGARSSSMASTIVKTFARNQTTDFPVIITYALIGNDVCNGHYGTGSMTTPSEFYKNVVEALDYLDTQLPKGSHLIFVGLVDGRILYDSMANRIHPIGSWWQDVTYAQFYDYMNCLQISPCFGWMNSDPYWRNATTQRAMELNQVYKEIIANHTYKNFDMVYFDPPLKAVVEEWKKRGGEAWQLIEPVDGFHPNQIANVLFANYQFNLYQKSYPYLVPPVNPNNALITKLFGDQGGY